MNMNDATLPDAHPTMLPGSGSNPAVETAGKRRRPERTPDQIARKRDQDREAQRLSRERTRKRIEDAESRLAESQASIANHERNLHQAIEERYDAQREASDLRKQLESALSQLDSARRHLASMSQLLSANNIQPHSPATTPLESNSLHPLPGPPQLQSPIASESSHSRSPPSHQDVLSIRNMIHRSASPAYMTALENQTIPQAPLQTMSRANISNHSSPSYVTEGSVYGSEGSPGSWADLSTHLPLNGPPTCPMDNILTMFSNSRKELLGQGESEEFVLGPRNPALCVLPSLGMRSNVGLRHPVSQMLAEVLSKVQQVLQPVPEQIAVLWVTHLSLRVSDILDAGSLPLLTLITVEHPSQQSQLGSIA